MFLITSFIWGQEVETLAPAKKIYFMPYVSYTMGNQYEYVFVGDYSTITKDTEDEMESLIDYQQNPLFKFGIKMESHFPWVYAVINLVDGIAGNTGYVYDYDWLANDENDNPVLTNFSQSTSSLNNLYSAELYLGPKIPVWKFDISPYGGASVEYSKYYASDGIAFYGDSTYIDDSDADIRLYYGNMLSLQRLVVHSWMGINIAFTPIEKLVINADGAISPYSYINSIDYHYLRSTFFKDTMQANFAVFRLGLSAHYNIKDNHALEIGYNFLNSSVIKGNTSSTVGTYVNSKTEWTEDTTAYSGCRFKYNSFYVGYRFLF